MAENNILDKFRSDHVDSEKSKVNDAMTALLAQVLNGAVSVIKAAISKDKDKTILFISMEDVEIRDYPLKFLLGMEKYNGKEITVYSKSGMVLVDAAVKNLDSRINTRLRNVSDHIIIEIYWSVDQSSDQKSDDIEEK